MRFRRSDWLGSGCAAALPELKFLAPQKGEAVWIFAPRLVAKTISCCLRVHSHALTAREATDASGSRKTSRVHLPPNRLSWMRGVSRDVRCDIADAPCSADGPTIRRTLISPHAKDGSEFGEPDRTAIELIDMPESPAKPLAVAGFLYLLAAPVRASGTMSTRR